MPLNFHFSLAPSAADLSDACIEIANTQFSGIFLHTKLPNPLDCSGWIECRDERYMQSTDCVTTPYNPDRKYCDRGFSCFFPNP